MNARGWRIHWGWFPAAVFCAVVGWTRYGWWTLLFVAIGLGIGGFAEWKARRSDA